MADSSRRLDIVLHYDTQQAEQASQAYNARQKQRIAELLTAEQVAEQAKQKLIRETNQAAVQDAAKALGSEREKAREAKQAASEIARTNRELNSLLGGLAKDEAREAREAAKERARAEREAFADAAKAARDATALENRMAREAAAEAKQAAQQKVAAEKAYNDAVNDMLRQHAVLERRYAAEAMAERRKQQEAQANWARIEADNAFDAFAKKQKALEGVNSTLAQGTKQVMSFGAAMLGLSSAQQVVSTFVGHFEKIRAEAFKATEDVMRMRGAVRELQALRGEIGQTGSGVSHVFDIARQTLQSTEDAQAMEQEGLGTGELAIKNERDKAEFAKAIVAAGKMQTVFGGGAAPYGKMMGQLALQSKGPLDAADMEARADRLFKIQQPGGFRSMESALQQYSGLNAFVMNDIYTPEEAMGLASAFSVSSPNEAGTKSEQFTRAVMAGRIRNRGMAVSKDVDMEKTAEYFKELGIGEQDSAIKRGKTIADDLARQKAAREAKGEKFNAMEYLMLHGFANQQDALAIMDFAGLRNSGRLEKIEEAQNAPLERGAISRRFNDRLAKDNYLKDRQAELLIQAGGTKQGLEEEPLVLAQKAAFGRLKAQGKISGTFEEWRNKSTLERTGEDILFGGYNEQVNRETYRSLFREQGRLGLNTGSYNRFGATEGEMRGMAQQIQGHGGDVTRGAAEALDKAAENIRKATEKLEEVMNPPGPPAALVGAGAAIYATRVH